MNKPFFCSLALSLVLWGADEYVEIIPSTLKSEATFVIDDLPKGKIGPDHTYKDITNNVGILFKNAGINTETKIINELRIENLQKQENAIGLKITGGNHRVIGAQGEGIRLVGFDTINSYLIHSSGGEVVFRNLFIADKHFGYITPPESFIHLYGLEKIYIGNGGVMRFEKDSGGSIFTGFLGGGKSPSVGERAEIELNAGTLSYGEISSSSYSVAGIKATNGYRSEFTLKDHSNIEFDSLKGGDATGIVAEKGSIQIFSLTNSAMSFKEISGKYALGLGAGCDGGLGIDMIGSTLRFDSIVGSKQSFGIYLSNDENTHDKHNSVDFSFQDSILSFGTLGSTGSLSIGIGIEQNAQDSTVSFGGNGIVNIEKMRGVSRDYGSEPYGSYVILALGGKVQNSGVRLYYGDYEEFDNSGNRAILYARFGEDKDESVRLKYDFASGLVMTTDIPTYESYEKTFYSRFRAVPNAGDIYLMHFSSPSNPHAISLNAKEFVVKNFTHSSGDAIGIRLEGKISLDFMAPKPFFASGSALSGRDVFRLSVGAGDVNFIGYQEVSKDGVDKGVVMYNLSELNAEENAYGIYLNAQGKTLNATLTDSLSQTTLNAPRSYALFITNGEVNLSGNLILTPKVVNAEHYLTLCNTGSILTINGRLANTDLEMLDSNEIYTLLDDLGGKYYFNTRTLNTFKGKDSRGGAMYLASSSDFQIADSAKVILDGEGKNTGSIILGDSANPNFAMGENAMLILKDIEGIKLKTPFSPNTSTLHLNGGAFVYQHSDILAPHTPFGYGFGLEFKNTQLYLGEDFASFHASDKRAGMFYSGESEILLDGGVYSEAMLFTQDQEVFEVGSESKKVLLTPKDGELYGIYLKEGSKKLGVRNLELRFKDFYHLSKKTYLIYNPSSKLAFERSYLLYNKENADAMIDLILNGETLYFNLGAHTYMDFSLNGVAPDESGVSFINNGGLKAMSFGGSGKVVFEGSGVIDVVLSNGSLGNDRFVINSSDVVVDFGANSLNLGANNQGVRASLGFFDHSAISLGRETYFESSNQDYALYTDANAKITLDGLLSFSSNTEQTGGIGGSGKLEILAKDNSALSLSVAGKSLKGDLHTLGKITSISGEREQDKITISLDKSKREYFKILTIGDSGEKGLGVGKVEYEIQANSEAKGVQIKQGVVQRSDMIVINSHQGRVDSPLQNTLKIYNPSSNTNQGEITILAYVKDSTQGVGEQKQDKVTFNNLKNGESGYAQGESADGIFSTQTKITRYDYNNDSYYVTDFGGERSVSEEFSHKGSEAILSPSSIYLANLNSLNKRLGELRWGGDGESGVWGRIFGGEVRNGGSVGYVTLQGGYDKITYMGVGERNYVGSYVAYNYGNGKFGEFEKVQSNAVEAGVYDVFIQDNGWYNDSIVKASYYLTDSTYSPTQEKTSMQNIAIAFSDEVGYSFNINGGFIQPQYEGSVAYFGDGNMELEKIKITQKSLVVVRNRLGVNWGYDFSSLMEKKRASVYVGTYFVYDYFKGGDVLMSDKLNLSYSQAFHSQDMRFALNVGSNFKLKDSLSLYFDFEKNFGGKINVEYQVNFGVRYELGEKPRANMQDQLEAFKSNLLNNPREKRVGMRG